MSEILMAAQRGSLEQIGLAISSGSSLADVNCDGETALALAAKHGHSQCVEALATARGVKVVDRWGRTPLMLAAIGGHLDCVRFLLGKMEHEDVCAKDFDGRSALMLSARHGRAECAGELLHKSRLQDCDLRGLNALEIAKKLGHAQIVEILKDGAPNVGKSDAFLASVFGR